LAARGGDRGGLPTAVRHKGCPRRDRELRRADGAGPPQLPPGADPELGEDLAEVPLDGPRAEVQRGGDLPAGEPFLGEAGDLSFLSGQLAGRLYRTFAQRLPCRREFA